jgi:replication factor A2
VLAFKIRLVDNPAEAEYHKTLATYVHLYNSFGPLPDVAPAPSPVAPTGQFAGGNVANSNAYQAQAPSYVAAAGAVGLSDLHRTVLQQIKSVKVGGWSQWLDGTHLFSQGGEGAALDDVMRTLRNVPQNQVREAIEYLSAEGHIYSTIDENHFRASN